LNKLPLTIIEKYLLNNKSAYFKEKNYVEYSCNGTPVDAMKLGAYDFLTKPCDIDEIVSKVEAAANKKRVHEEKIKDAEQKKLLSKLEP